MNDSAFTKSGLSVYLYASSARTITAAAEPSDTPEQSKMPSAPATWGEHAITSLATSLRNCARGFSAPFLWFFQAMRVIASLNAASSTPNFLQYAGASRLKVAGAVRPARVPSSGAPMLGRPEMPESFSFSTPMAMATSYAPQATAQQALRQDSEAVAPQLSRPL